MSSTITPSVLAETALADLTDRTYRVAILPWGATEPHNQHLPYGTDIFETGWIAAEAARRANTRGAGVIALPTVPFGVNTGQLAIPLTINMNPSTQMAILRDVIDSLIHHHIPKLLILNGHGGNDFKQIIRELQNDCPVFLCTANWYRTVPLRDYFAVPGDHADEMETSVMMHIAPELVRPLSVAGNGATRALSLSGFREGWAWAQRDWPLAAPDTGAGDPHAATAEKGKRYLEAVVTRLADFFVELAETSPEKMYK
jgi:creatinine amidohydrolase